MPSNDREPTSVAVRNGSVSLHAREIGDPKAPPLLLLHGMTQSSATWRWWAPELALRYRVWCLDFRGHGMSDRAPGAYGLADYLSDVLAVCTHGAGSPWLVVGHSLGGTTALALAQSRPDLVRAVVAEDPPLVPAATTPTDSNPLFAQFALLRSALPSMHAAGMDPASLAAQLADMPDSSGAGTCGEVFTPDGLAAAAEGFLEVDPGALDPLLDGTLQPLFDLERPLPVPGLVVAADPKMLDAVARPEDLQRLVEMNPHVVTTVVGGAGHGIHTGRKTRDAFRQATTSFLDAIDAMHA